MAVIALASASGSPGVTSTAVGLALLWPRPVLLVEADPTGGSALLSGYLGGTREYENGLIELALATGDLRDGLAEVTGRIEGTNVSYVAGTRSHAQASALHGLWQPLMGVLADLESAGQDVIIDAGRLGLAGSPGPLLAGADLALIVTRTSLPAVSAVRSWIDSIKRGALDWREPGLLLVGQGQPFTSGEVARALGFPVLATLPDDSSSAGVFSRGERLNRKFETGPLVRGLRAVIATIHSTVSQRRSDLAQGVRP